MNRFTAGTGIREHEWKGRFWARWNDALADAGFGPNAMQRAYSEDEVMTSLIDEIRRRGKMPTEAGLSRRRCEDSTLPDPLTEEHVIRTDDPKASNGIGIVGSLIGGRTESGSN